MTLTEKLRGSVADLQLLGSVGAFRALVGVVVVLAGLLMYQQARFTDRWTATEARAYQKDHGEEHAELLREWNAANTEILQRLARIEAKQNGSGKR